MQSVPNLLPVYVHDLNPFALQFTESFGIRWYGLAYLAGFYAAFLIISWMGKRGLSPLPPALASDFVFTAAMGTIIGGRLGYCLFYSQDLLTQFSSSPPFWGVFAINRGGMASHGGIIGIVCACIYFGKKHKITPPHLFDLTTLGGSIGIFFGRLANFVNGELVGRPTSSDIPWAVKFPQDILLWDSGQLRNLYDTVAALGVNRNSWQAWTNDALWNLSAKNNIEQTLSAIISAIQNGNHAVRDAISGVLVARHPSQIYEALGEGVFLFLALLWIWRLPRKPGVITGWFFTLYALVRIMSEQFRMPDPQIGFQIFGLTRGQILSILMFVIGIVCLYVWSRINTSPLGGWKQISRIDTSGGVAKNET